MENFGKLEMEILLSLGLTILIVILLIDVAAGGSLGLSILIVVQMIVVAAGGNNYWPNRHCLICYKILL